MNTTMTNMKKIKSAGLTKHQQIVKITKIILVIAVVGIGFPLNAQSKNIHWASDYPGSTANEKINNALKSAVEAPGNNVIGLGSNGPDENGQWLLTESIKLPSHTTLILSGAHVKVADGVKTVMVENDDPVNGNTDIHVIGWGEAKLDGNAQREPERSGGSIHFYKVDNLSLKGLQIGATAGWAFTLEDVTNVHISNLHFFQGNEHPWQDGIHVVGPANSVVINNITGAFGDDVIVVDAAMGRKGNGGLVTGVTVTNVVATNVWGAAILRTIAAKGKPVDGVYCSNLTFFSKGGGSDAAVKIGWDGKLEEVEDWEQPSPEEHKNIVIENLYVPFWIGPVITIQNSVKNLTLRNVTATHQGPFFYNLEHAVDGLTIDNCHSTLIGNPPETLVPEFFSALLNKKVYTLSKEYKGTFIKDPPGTIAFDYELIRDVTISNTIFDFKGKTTSADYPIALRVYNTAKVDGLFLHNIKINNYKTGIQIDKGSNVKDFDYDRVRYSDVDKPMVVPKEFVKKD